MKKLPARVTTTFGIHVRGTPLWIDATARKELCIVTSITAKLPPAHTRLVATPELAKLLSAAGHKSNVLATPRDRWVGVGGEQVQLVDCGAPRVSAAAVVKLREETVLVTGPLRATPVDWPRADHIIAHVPALRHQGDELAAVVDAVVAATRHVRCSVRVESLEVAAAMARALHERGVCVKARGLVATLTSDLKSRTSDLGPRISDLGSRPSDLGSRKSDLENRPSDLGPRAHVVDLALTRLAHAPGRSFDIDSGLRSLRGADVTLPLRWFADRSGVEALVASARPKRLTLVGPHVSGLTVPTEVIWQTEPRQLSLGEAHGASDSH